MRDPSKCKGRTPPRGRLLRGDLISWEMAGGPQDRLFGRHKLSPSDEVNLVVRILQQTAQQTYSVCVLASDGTCQEDTAAVVADEDLSALEDWERFDVVEIRGRMSR